MKYFTGAIFIVLMIAACSTPEVVMDEQAETEPDSGLPSWFSPNTISSSGANQFSGYSMAVASDSSEAVQTGNESAIANVRFEIDRFAEEIREELINDQSADYYGRPDFIIKLRNAVQELQLTHSEFEREFEEREDNITQVYTRVTVDRAEMIERLSELISDEPFTRALTAEW
jgi:hypothetical protein